MPSIFLLTGSFMKYQILTVGLKDDLLSLCREHFSKGNTELKNVLDIFEAVGILKGEPSHLLNQITVDQNFTLIA